MVIAVGDTPWGKGSRPEKPVERDHLRITSNLRKRGRPSGGGREDDRAKPWSGFTG